jgi:hypothetical protein
MVLKAIAMRAKCPKCGVVFETPWQPTLVHIGSIKSLRCPACGQRSMMHTNVKGPVNWPVEEGAKKEGSDETSDLSRRIEDSKYE